MKKLIEKVKATAKQRFKNNASGHGWDHVERVRALALVMGRKEKANLEVIETAALLHDIKRLEETKKGGAICHAKEGAKEAEKILKRLGAQDKFIKEVKHCIESHRYRNGIKPRSVEAMVLSDADKLDALGAIGVGRGFMWCGHHGLSLHNTDKKPILENNPYQKTHSLYAEYMIKLRYLKNKMYTRAGKEIAHERTGFMKGFLKRLNLETKGKR